LMRNNFIALEILHELASLPTFERLPPRCADRALAGRTRWGHTFEVRSATLDAKSALALPRLLAGESGVSAQNTLADTARSAD
jgi:hypothetical protein